MRHSIFLILFFFCVINSYSKDKIILCKGKTIKGTITQLEENKITIQKGKKELEFTPEQVQYIEFDANNLKISKVIRGNADFNYLDGQTDAQLYHKRFGGNFALGVLFGVFGFIGVAVGNVQDPNPVIPDYQEKINSADYREGYRKKGKGKNMGAAGAGWAVGAIIMIIIAASSAS